MRLLWFLRVARLLPNLQRPSSQECSSRSGTSKGGTSFAERNFGWAEYLSTNVMKFTRDSLGNEAQTADKALAFAGALFGWYQAYSSQWFPAARIPLTGSLFACSPNPNSRQIVWNSAMFDKGAGLPPRGVRFGDRDRSWGRISATSARRG
jgi:hypothetical protein